MLLIGKESRQTQAEICPLDLATREKNGEQVEIVSRGGYIVKLMEFKHQGYSNAYSSSYS